ncbi:MAG: hypothetical protein RL885_09545 [Planctomycetota bacterium]
MQHRHRRLFLGAGVFLLGGVAWAVSPEDESPDASSVAPVSDHRVIEAQANTWTQNRQWKVALDADSEGHLLVAWGSRRQEAGTFGVFAQRFDVLGRRLGTEIHVNEYLPGAQTNPAVTIDASGQAWIVWESGEQDGHAGGVFGRRFGMHEDGSFAALSGELAINETTRGHQGDASVAVDADGRALVTWISNHVGRPVAMGRLFDASGEALTQEFRLGDADQGRESVASAAATPDGFVTTWAAADADGFPATIRTRRFTAKGEAQGASVAIAGKAGEWHIEPSIDSADDGRHVIAWMADATQQGDYCVLAQVFGADGKPVSGVLDVARAEGGYKSGASVAMSSSGRFVVSYNEFDQRDPRSPEQRPAVPSTVFAKEFDAKGQAIGERFQVNQTDSGLQRLAIGSPARRAVWTARDQVAFVWHGQTREEDSTGAGLTLFVPGDLTAPDVVEPPRVAAAQDVSYEDAGGLTYAPPEFDPFFEPEPPDQAPAGTGPDEGFQGFQNTGWNPPDPDIAVGPNHLVVVVNGGVRFFTKDGNQTFSQSLNGFFAPVGTNDFAFDPIALYDASVDRYVIGATEHDGNTDLILFAISDDNDPNGTWHKYRFNVNSLCGFIDFPNMGAGDDAYYIATDCFSSPSGNRVWIIEKTPALSGSPITLRNVQTSGSTRSLGAVHHYDSGAAGQYFATSYSGSSTRIDIDSIRNPLTSPIRNSFSLIVPGFSQPPDATQLGTSNRADTVDFRIKNGVYRNGRLYLAHTIGQSSTARVRWYEIDMRGWPTSGLNPTLLQSGTLNYGTGQHNWFADISVTSDGTVALAFNRSSSADFIYTARAWRRATDTSGSMRPPIETQRSTSSETGSRWGDYGGLHEDPVAPGVFWSMHEYRTSSWRTWVGKFDTNKLSYLQSDLIRGALTTTEISGAEAGETCYLLGTFTGSSEDLGPCYGGECLDLLNPVFNVGSGIADAQGVATFSFIVPPSAPLITIWAQAVVLRPGPVMVESNIQQKTIQ